MSIFDFLKLKTSQKPKLGKRPRTLLESVVAGLNKEQRGTSGQQGEDQTQKTIDERNRQSFRGEADAHIFLTDEQKAADEGRILPAHHRSNEALKRQVAIKEARQEGGLIRSNTDSLYSDLVEKAKQARSKGGEGKE